MRGGAICSEGPFPDIALKPCTAHEGLRLAAAAKTCWSSTSLRPWSIAGGSLAADATITGACSHPFRRRGVRSGKPFYSFHVKSFLQRMGRPLSRGQLDCLALLPFSIEDLNLEVGKTPL